MKKLLFFLTIILFSFISCTPSDDNIASTVLVKKTVRAFTNSQVTEVVDSTYDGNKLKTITHDGILYYEFMYTNEKLTRVNYPYQDSYFIIEYDDLGKVVRFMEYRGSNSVIRTEITYSGTDFTRTHYVGNSTAQEFLSVSEQSTIVNGNLVQMTIMEPGFEARTFTYTYDDKKNPFRDISNFEVFKILEIEIAGTANNVISFVSTGDSYPFTKAYTYNASNFPITEQKLYNDFVSTTTTYTYFE